MKSHLDRIASKGADVSADSTPKHTSRSSVGARPNPTPESEIYHKKCVVCGFVKHRGDYEKYRISETNRAMKFLEAAVFMQDDVYTRTCDLQDIHAVFGADLYCHKQCVNRYLLKYERFKDKSSEDKSTNHKNEAWTNIISDMAETIRSTDPIRQCADIIRQSLLDIDFDLEDRFCDANDLRTSWNAVPVPEPLLKFMATLYNFDPTEFTAGPRIPDDEDVRPKDMKDERAGISESRSRQMHCLFQIM